MPEARDSHGTNGDYEDMGIDELVASLATDVKSGLSSEEHTKRITFEGYNEVTDKKANQYINFAKKFSGPTAWMLEAVIVLSLILGNYADVYVVIALLVLNAVLGYFQEQKASKAVDALKKQLQINARVLRDGTWHFMPSRELVPGDIVRIRAGDFVPADIKILDGRLDVDQSALTGESLSVPKEHAHMLFSGSITKSGEATGLVVFTGAKTYFGKTTELVQFARPRLQVEEVVSQIVKWLLVIVGLALVITFAVSSLAGMNILDILPLALVLLASSIPVALPAMFTITMALGSMELAKRGVLVTRLSASEDAATMDTLCLDKTGTITMNRLTVAGIVTENGMSEEDVLMFGALASEVANHDPIDNAFIISANDRKISIDGFIRLSFIPFDPATRRTETIVEKNGERYRIVKGAISAIVELTGTDPASLRTRSAGFAAKGYRTLAVALGVNEKPLSVIGLVALSDMPRADAGKLISDLQNLGISVRMLTGDALPIAQETARQVGLSGTISGTEELDSLQQTDPAKASCIIEESIGFARIYPQDKYRIVKSLQESGHIVGMTGDGINDAPSLRQAEVGIAVSNATDVAKGAASAVLTREGLGNIVDLIRVGRMIHQRMLTWIFNKVVKTFQIVVFVVVAFLLTGQFIVSVFDVVLLLFVIDFVTLSLSTDNVRGSQKPDSWDISELVRSSLVLGVLVVLESLVILAVGLGPLGLTGKTTAIQTFSFAILFYFGMLTVFVVRERGHFWDSFPSRSLFLIMLADMCLVAVLVTVGIPGLTAIPPVDTLTVISMSVFFSFVINDFVKYFMLMPGKNKKTDNITS
ncbi:plasma-membrane proton-efflux P-type ATPase [Methanoregula sp.]|uniref:plasma-membrane proton-efflux P-type ATPase n=1 Tax=Methanoregula sp. TaxID=2052170 RepID=UPI003C767AC9